MGWGSEDAAPPGAADSDWARSSRARHYALKFIYMMSHPPAEMTAFDVLAEPHRRQILDLLRDSERPVGELVTALSMSQPSVSKHLRVLRDAGLVDVRGEAQRRLYPGRPQPLRAIDDWLGPPRRMW